MIHLHLSNDITVRTTTAYTPSYTEYKPLCKGEGRDVYSFAPVDSYLRNLEYYNDPGQSLSMCSECLDALGLELLKGDHK